MNTRFLVPLLICLSTTFFLACKSQTSKNETPGQSESQEMISEVLSLEEFKQRIAQDKIQLVDVRTPEEFAEGKIMNAKNVDYLGENFESGINAFNKEEPIYIYCRSGGRSAKSAAIMQELGFKEIYDLEGGYNAWSAAKN